MAARGLCPAAMDRGSLQTRQAAELWLRYDHRMAHVSPGAVRVKTARREPQSAGKAWTGPGMRLVTLGVLVLGWRRPGGAVRAL